MLKTQIQEMIPEKLSVLTNPYQMTEYSDKFPAEQNTVVSNWQDGMCSQVIALKLYCISSDR